MEGSRRIDSLQILRAIACTGVFAFHSGLIISGHWTVSIFIMLSGFLLYYKNSERDVDSSVKKSFSFSLKRIVKLYPLHIITMIMIIVIRYRTVIKLLKDTTNGILVFVGQILSNVFLVKSWIPNEDYCFSFNSVSWYLSTALFLYLVFPKLLKFYKKRITTVKKAIISMVIVILVEASLSFAVFLIDVPIMGGSGDFTGWFSYVFPVLRVADLFIGMNLAYIFMNRKALKKLTVNIFEIVAVIVIVLIEFFFRISQDTPNANWFKYNLICIIPAALLLYSFATNKGFIEKVLNNKIVRLVGKLSGYFFLLQVVAIWIVRYFMPRITHNYIDYIIQDICAFILTTIMAYVWSKLDSKVRAKIHGIKS